jgi:UDP-N-acetylglucosamine/UDP-N-acetylgalactosamine diphosphorylase
LIGIAQRVKNTKEPASQLNPKSTMDEDLKRTANFYGQEHLVEHSEREKSALFLADIKSIDFEATSDSFGKAMAGNNNEEKPVCSRMAPIEQSFCESIRDCSEETLKAYHDVALEAISKNEVGMLCLAGGQGTRLGVAIPKGLYDLKLPSKKSLYQIQMERGQRLAMEAKAATGKDCNIPVFIMTSEQTKAPTEEFFKKHSYFGLDPSNLFLFEQRTIPCMDNDGKIIIENRDKVARAPDGNGGLYWALQNERILDEFERRGVKFLHVYCVDNVLVRVADPIFMGYCISKGAESGNKVVEKAFPEEGVGVVCKVDNRVQVIEYSEIGKEVSERRDENGKLTFRAANICIHFFTTEFLKRVCTEHESELPQHVARKKVPYYDASKGVTVKPTANNGSWKNSSLTFFSLRVPLSCGSVLGTRSSAHSRTPTGPARATRPRHRGRLYTSSTRSTSRRPAVRS